VSGSGPEVFLYPDVRETEHKKHRKHKTFVLPVLFVFRLYFFAGGSGAGTLFAIFGIVFK